MTIEHTETLVELAGELDEARRQIDNALEKAIAADHSRAVQRLRYARCLLCDERVFSDEELADIRWLNLYNDEQDALDAVSD